MEIIDKMPSRLRYTPTAKLKTIEISNSLVANFIVARFSATEAEKVLVVTLYHGHCFGLTILLDFQPLGDP